MWVTCLTTGVAVRSLSRQEAHKFSEWQIAVPLAVLLGCIALWAVSTPLQQALRARRT